jgi:hypothetical protein
MWLGRTRLDVLKPEKAGRRKEKDEGKRGKAGRRRRPSRRD